MPNCSPIRPSRSPSPSGRWPTLPVVFAELARQYSPVESQRSRFSHCRRQRPVHPHPPRHLRRRRWPCRGRRRHPRRRRPRPRRESSGRKIRFRYGADAVRTRMYRNYRQLRDGWTKNLALLFPNPGWLAVKTLLLWATVLSRLLFLAHDRIIGSTLAGYGIDFAWRYAVRYWRIRIGPCKLSIGYEISRRPLRHAHVRLLTATLEASPRERQSLLERPNLRSEDPVNDFPHHAPTTAGRLS